MSSRASGGPKIVIIGAGFVGTTFAYSLLIHGLASQIAIIDIDKKRADGEVMDLNHGMAFAYPTKIWDGDYSDCKDADVIVITAGQPQQISQSRLELAQSNFKMVHQIIPEIVKYNTEGILLVVTNPLDVMTCAALKLSGFPVNRVIGSGTSLDTARLRFMLGEHVKVDPRNVHAFIIGEHGDSEVPVWSLANVAGINLKNYCALCGIPHDAETFDKLFLEVRNAGYKIIERKGRTNYAVALALTRIIENITRDENAVLPVSCFLENYLGVSDVCLSVPVVLNRSGVKHIIELPLDKEELEGFHKSAELISRVNKSLGL